jgi:hypothetical protein
MDKSILTEEINNMRFLFGYQPGKLISEQETPVSAVDLIKQIQRLLKTNYGANLGTSGPNKDGIDGVWGKNTQTALENAIKTIETAAPAPAAAPSPAPAPAPAPATPVVASSNVPDEDNSSKPETPK